MRFTIIKSKIEIHRLRKKRNKPNKLRGNGLRWTSTPFRGSRNTPSRFEIHATKTGDKLQQL